MSPEQPRPGVDNTQELQNHEPALINLYRELTGEDESHARSTFMYVVPDTPVIQPPTQ